MTKLTKLVSDQVMKPYYEQDGVTIYNGDNCDVMGALPKESVDLIVTSPPYDDLRTYGGHSWDFYGVAWQLKRILKPGGVIVWIVNDATKDGSETGTSFQQALHFKQLGLNLHDTMIYAKDACPFPEVNRYYPSFEYKFILSKGKPKSVTLLQDKQNARSGDLVGHSTQREKDGATRKVSASHTDPGRGVKEMGVRQNIWRYSAGFGKSTKDVIAFEHPATFPEALARDHILSWSSEGDTVLDCFNGSGTVTKIARNLGRKAIGIEINQAYCEIAVKRLAQGILAFD